MQIGLFFLYSFTPSFSPYQRSGGLTFICLPSCGSSFYFLYMFHHVDPIHVLTRHHGGIYLFYFIYIRVFVAILIACYGVGEEG